MTPKFVCVGNVLLLFCGLALAAQPSGTQTFVGNISDSACGLHHTMGGSAKSCTLMCVNMGSKFVLADEAHHKVYALSDQAKAKPFAGEKVRVVGSIRGASIEVTSITAVK
ncbi:MAG TPA: hypothetical protein VMI06_03285 [Terriglobia bacterium]|nr:hypothetical protein [Terriglobia bacterium]